MTSPINANGVISGYTGFISVAFLTSNEKFLDISLKNLIEFVESEIIPKSIYFSDIYDKFDSYPCRQSILPCSSSKIWLSILQENISFPTTVTLSSNSLGIYS